MLKTLKLDDEAGRLAALQRYDILDTGIEDEFEQLVQLVQRVFDMPMAAITLVDSERQWFKARRGLDVSETPRPIAFCHHTIATADVLAVEDTLADPRFAASPLVLGDPNIRSYLGAPLRTPDGYHVGALCIISDEVRRFSPEDLEILRRFSDLVVSQMELRQLASRDSLTDTLTRRAFDQAVSGALQTQRHSGAGHAVAILDIDHFKRVNDSYGHKCGDDVLKAVADRLRAALPAEAIIGRLGGEEFGVLLDLSDALSLVAAGECVRSAVASVRIAAIPDSGVTVSVGLALLTPGDTTESWMDRADVALYAAKAAGRDRVMLG
ncbi:GGDEF domain-containing protein [Polymorphobacter fuscus]|nr:sensor domain-containing diguanylate cyclase [Polymorphobacter fuscus]NJC10103.1 diguanylate cyclase (GGDEF)-like protein [Polymorphobacter fuscus]